MNEDVTGLLASMAAIIIVLALSYFYKQRFKHNILEGQQGLVGFIVFIICIAAAIFLLN